jgi:prolycopene isomerase
VVPADRTPAINAGMVFSDRHYGGINYPKGGVGKIAEKLAEGLTKTGGEIRYGERVTQIIPKAKSGKQAIGVKLANGKVLYAKKVVSNATRWDTFGNLLKDEAMPTSEKNWQERYQKSPSFLSLHLGVKASVIADSAACHHILLEDWEDMQKEQGTIFVSIPTLLDRSLAPEGYHIIHTFTPSWMSEWEGLTPSEYEQRKDMAAKKLCDRLSAIFPELQEGLDYQEIGTPRSHRRFLGRMDGTYGPIPKGKPWGLLGMPFNRTSIPDLYCVGDSTFPGQGLNAVAFSGFACGHLVASTLGLV